MMTEETTDSVTIVVCPQCGIELEAPKDVPEGQHVSCSECGCQFLLSADASFADEKTGRFVLFSKMLMRSLVAGWRCAWPKVKSFVESVGVSVKRCVWPRFCTLVVSLEEVLKRHVSPKVSLSPVVCMLVLVGVFALAASAVGFNAGTSSGKVSAPNMRRKAKSVSFRTGASSRTPSGSNIKRDDSNGNSLGASEGKEDDVCRSHVFKNVECDVFYDFTVRIRALPNGEYNTIMFRSKYEDPEKGVVNAYNAYGVRVGQLRPLPGRAKVLSTKTVIFNGDVGKVFGAFRTAFRKAREWIEVSKKKGKTPSGMLDMNIEVPDGCALEIPSAEDAILVFHELSNSTNLKQMKSGFKFWFTDKDRVLLFQCGDVTFDFRWSVEKDEKTLTCAESACDENRLLQLYTGRPGEADLFRMGQKHSMIPLDEKSSEVSKWKSISGRHATLEFPNGMTAGLVRCSDDSLNYFFCPYWMTAYVSTALVFPGDSYDEAYHAIEKAFMTALAWKSVAQEHRVSNIVKEMEIPCPKSAGIVITGRKGAVDLLWKSVGNADQDVMPTRFWFSVETRQTTSKDGKWVYEPKNTKYYLRFGNDDIEKIFELNDETIAAFSSLNPRLALQALEAAVQDKAKERGIFK